MKNKLYH